MDGTESTWVESGGNALLLWLGQRILVMAMIACFFGFVMPFVAATIKRLRLAARGVPNLDTMSGDAIDRVLEVRFRGLGYDVRRPSLQGTWGSDLILEKDGVRTLVVTKQTKRDVAIRPIEEALTMRANFHCDKALFIATHTFSPGAIKLADLTSVEMWDRNRLIREVLAIRPRDVRLFTAESVAMAASA